MVARFFGFMILHLYQTLTSEGVAQTSKMDVQGGLGEKPPTR